MRDLGGSAQVCDWRLMSELATVFHEISLEMRWWSSTICANIPAIRRRRRCKFPGIAQDLWATGSCM
jgi:hypothetical protein